MNIQEYISSGIVETYVLGLASHEERSEFERMCAAHPEVQRAREMFELAIEEQAMKNAIPPAKNVKSKIFAEIEIENEKISGDRHSQDPSSLAKEVTSPAGKVVSVSWGRYVAAASLALLLISTALNFYFFSQYKSYSNRYETLLAQQTELAKSNDVMRTRLDTYESTLAMLRDPDMAVIKMPGTNVPTSPDSNSVATVYWNTRSKDVFLLVNNLPQPPSHQQYQLWAIVDGQPLDAGVFDVQNTAGLLRMKNMPRAHLFAVTLEKRGGSPAPQGPMYVMGKAS